METRDGPLVGRWHRDLTVRDPYTVINGFDLLAKNLSPQITMKQREFRIAQIAAQSSDEDRQENLRAVRKRLARDFEPRAEPA